jgi:hypothetical protein
VKLERIRVIDLQLDPPITDADFDVEVRPGELVETRWSSEPVSQKERKEPTADIHTFRVDDSGSWSEVIVENGKERPRGAFRWWYAIGLLAIPLAYTIRRLYVRRTAT